MNLSQLKETPWHNVKNNINYVLLKTHWNLGITSPNFRKMLYKLPI